MNLDFEPQNGSGFCGESLSIELTTHCNSRCTHCFARVGIAERSSLDIDLVNEIIAEGHNAAYRHLHITGGEPLLWEGLFEILDYAFDLGFKSVFLNTNGILLSEPVVKQLAGCEGLSISVSLQGPESLHDRVRGKGSFGLAVQGIEKALDAGIGLFIFTPVCKSLIPDLPHFADRMYTKFPTIKCLTLIQLIRVTDDIFDLSQELLDPENFLKLVRMVSLLNLYGLKIDVLNNPLATVASKLLEVPWIPHFHTSYRARNLTVMANRNITLSHSLRDSFGKFEPGMIREVLASDEYRDAVAPDNANCPSCEYYKLCMENGMNQPSEWFRDMHPEVPYCKRVLARVKL